MLQLGLSARDNAQRSEIFEIKRPASPLHHYVDFNGSQAVLLGYPAGMVCYRKVFIEVQRKCSRHVT